MKINDSLTCPHLHEGQVAYCKVSADGVYIPTAAHKKKYCKSGQPQTCFQYLKSDEMIRWINECKDTDSSGTRRRYRRFSEKLPLFVGSSANGLPPQKNEYLRAFTVNLGLGGLQVSTAEELEPDQEIFFIFGDTFSKPYWEGVGVVRWCKSGGSENRFLAGLSFNDQSQKGIMAYHLGGHLS